MTAPTPSVTQASAAAKERADAAYTGVAGIERVDGDKSDEMERLHAFVKAVNDAEGRVEVVDPDAPLVHRTYRLPESPMATLRRINEGSPDRLALFEAWLAAGEPGPTPGQAPGTVLGSGKPGDVGAIPPEVIERAAYAPRRLGTEGLPALDYEATGQTTRAGLEPDTPGDRVAADWMADPVLIVEQDPDTYVATCQLCEGKVKHAVQANSPGAARASIAGHMRRDHNRSPWPGSQ